MNADAPRCRRCEGTRFVHVLRVRDSYLLTEGEDTNTRWGDRPVRRATNVHGEEVGIGHFGLWICRDCRLAEWLAHDWQLREPLPLRSSHCDVCEADTPHATFPAIDRVRNDGFSETRITRGMCGREGSMQMRICARCELVDWSALDYAHLDRTHHVRYRRVKEPERPCLRCGEEDCLLDDTAMEADSSIPISIGPKARRLVHHLFAIDPTFGRFQLRVCIPCSAVEWYGHDLDAVIPSDNVRLVGDAPQMAQLGGPYR